MNSKPDDMRDHESRADASTTESPSRAAQGGTNPGGPNPGPAGFRRRRELLVEWLGQSGDIVVVVPGASEVVRNRDVHYPFRQNSDFLYLTGFSEPDALLVLTRTDGRLEHLLFCRPRDPDMETWHGRRLGPDAAVERLGLDRAHPLDECDQVLPGLLENRHVVCAPWGDDEAFDQQLFAWIAEVRENRRAGVRAPAVFTSLHAHLHEMRLFKDADERRCMRQAGRVAGEAHRLAMQACRPGMFEYELEAVFLGHFRGNGMQPSYPAIVGGGENGCILHYTENDAPLNDGDLVLIDAGCESQGYASDITRTFPVSGRFSAVQRDVCEIVLAAQLAAIDVVRVGRHWNEPHEVALRVLTQGLIDLGVLAGDLDGLLEQEAYRPFYMHRTGHWLGLDVHDVGDYRIDGVWRALEPAMVLTVEPGLYFGPRSGAPEALLGIGVRIEDDVLVTRKGPEVLTPECPKAPDEIEALMRESDTAWRRS